ncbi:MAG: hypothetical protein O7E52_29895 [Candidatus Poribacteria bacterium]|nr:hypothetical protein [Candidatus Poribacteria bacterium]
MIDSRPARCLYRLSILYVLLASCSSPIGEIEPPWKLPAKDETLIQAITEPILLSKVETPLHW